MKEQVTTLDVTLILSHDRKSVAFYHINWSATVDFRRPLAVSSEQALIDIFNLDIVQPKPTIAPAPEPPLKSVADEPSSGSGVENHIDF